MTPYIILFTLICSFLSQKLMPKFMNSTIIHDGAQIQNKIGPHEIFVYQFETNSLDVLFLFRGIEKRTLIYGYEAKNIEELQLKESNLLRYLSQNVLYDFSINQLNNTDQFIVIVYCPLDVSCEYFISFLNDNEDFSYTINAIDNQSFLFQFLPRNNDLFTFTLPNNLTENTDIIFSLNTTIYSGVVNIKEVTINNRKQNISWNVKGVQEMLSLPVDKDSTIQIKLNALYSGFVILNYRFSEELITNIEIDITKVYSILNNSKKVFILPKYSFFENASILLNIKSENCNMKITELSNKAELLSESQIYYQYRFIEADDYPIEVYLHNEDNKNEKCTFYTYATQNEISYKVLAMEGISYRIKITKYLELISFQLPYIYHSELSDSINILFSISDNKDAYIDIIIQHYSVYSKCINGNNINANISTGSLKRFCLENTICIINIYLSSVKSEDDFYVDFKISANRQVLHYIPFNTIIKDTFSQQFTRLFYTFIKQNDEGRIKLIYQNKALPMKYKVINKKNIWFLTLFSLILALSVYYVTMPSELLLDVYNNNGEAKKDTDVIDIEETDIISVYRLEQETKINEELDVLKLILLDNEASIDKKNEAYTKMQNLQKIKGLENLIEDQIDQKLKLKAFVKIQDNTINVIVRNDKHDVSLANKIMNLVQKNFEEKKYISVKFE